MIVKFKYSRAIDNKTYAKGVHEVEDSFVNHWYFKALVSSGDATIVDEAKSEIALKESTDAKEDKKKSGAKKAPLTVKKEEPAVAKKEEPEKAK